MKNYNGFTLIETIVTVSLIAIAFSFFVINFTRLPSATNQSLAETKLISDIRYQQAQSMNGILSYITFGSSSYTLMPQNVTVNLEDGITIVDNNFPNSKIEFAQNSGDIVGYTVNQDSLSLKNDIDNKILTIRLNKYASTY